MNDGRLFKHNQTFSYERVTVLKFNSCVEEI